MHMRLYIKKICKIFLVIICLTVICFSALNYESINQKSKNLNKNQFIGSLKQYDNYYTKLISILSMPKSKKKESNVFYEINQVLFNNKAILVDSNMFSSAIKNINNEHEVNDFYKKYDFNNNLIISYAIEINYIMKLFKVY